MSRRFPGGPVAVIGLACWYPDANTPLQFWENILSRRRAFRRLPDCRLPQVDYIDPERQTPDTTYGSRAAVIDGFDFDWAARRIPRATVQSTDVVHWLALETALAAVEDAGFDGASIPGEHTGVIVGNTLTGEQTRSAVMRLRWPYVRRTLEGAAAEAGLDHRKYHDLERAMLARYKAVFPPVTEDTLAGGLANTIAGRICNYLDLQGGGYIVDGACSSSLLAVAAGVERLVDHDLDLAVIGGVDISLDPFEMVGFAKTGALSPGDMHVYDRRGKGFIPGEGCGFVVLKRLEDARRDGNTVYAVIHGWGISSDGRGAGITAPSVRGQAHALRRAFRGIPFAPHTLDFIEGHGTGTAVGDPIELKAVHTVLSEDPAFHMRSCGMTSLKSIIGHTKAASGIGGLIKAVIAVNRRVLPPIAGCDQPHALFETELPGLYPILHGECRPADSVLHAGVSSMGFGGINCHVTVGSGDPASSKLSPAIDETALLASNQSGELFILSENTPGELAITAEKLAGVSAGISVAELTDLAADLAGRVNQEACWRGALEASDPEVLSRRLLLMARRARARETAWNGEEGVWIGRFETRPRVGMLFPGQGSQQLNMARILIQRFQWARRMLAQAEAIVGNIDGRTLGQWIFRDTERARDARTLERWRKALGRTDIAQPAICLTSALWLTFLKRLGMEPAAVGGHSLGEVTACYAAGAFDFEALLAFSALRGAAMAAAGNGDGAMAALACTPETARQLCSRVDGYVTVANLNAPRQTVVSGDARAVDEVVALARSSQISGRPLPVSGAFHSRYMIAAVADIEKKARLPRAVPELSCRIFSTLDGNEIAVRTPLRSHLGRQITAPVDFTGMLKTISSEVDMLMEVGPGRVLTGLTAANLGDSGTACLPVEAVAENADSLNRMLAMAYVRGARIQWPELYACRLVRPFTAPSEKRFVVNTCEIPLPETFSDSETMPHRDNTTFSETPVGDLGGLAGLTANQMNAYLQRRSRFLAGVIRADLDSSDLPLVDVVSSTGHNEHFRQNKPEKHSSSTPAPGDESNGDLRSRLLDLIEKITGFAPETISLQYRLLDDLNLDSIKAGDLLVELARQAGVQWPDNPSALANARLEEILAALEQLRTSQDGGLSAESESHACIAADAGDALAASPKHLPAPAWVRDFRLVRREEDPPEIDPGPFWDTANVAVLHDPSTVGIAAAMQKLLLDYGASAACISTWTDDSFSADDLRGYSHRIAIMPPEALPLEKTVEMIPDMVARRSILIRGLADGVVCTAFVQFGGGRFGRTPRSANLPATACTALAAGLHHEYPHQRFCSVDVPSSWRSHQVADTVLREIASAAGFSAAGYDTVGSRWFLRPELSAPADYRPRELKWSSGDVILVSGGAKGISAECAMAAARATGAQLALVGRTIYGNGTDAAEAIDHTLNRMADEDITALYYDCDITDADAVVAVVSRIRKTQGTVRGVIHGAGANHPRPAGSVTAAQAQAEIAPKVVGLLNIWSALKDTPPDLMVGLSSIIGITGMPGNTWYGFANEALDILLQAIEADSPCTRTQSVAFSIWRDTGMGARMGSVTRLSLMGIDAIPTDEGSRRFARLFTHDARSSVVIVTARLGGLDTWSLPGTLEATEMVSSSGPPGRFRQKLVTHTPGVEAVFDAHVSLELDLYVQDHRFQGSYLFPTVFGLEAMTQAALAATGRRGFTGLRLEKVRLERPITVDEASGADIRIWAQVVENDDPDLPLRLRAGIRKTGTGVRSDYFSATLVFDSFDLHSPPEDSAWPAAMPMEPLDDLYRQSLLFQGPRFQRITHVHALKGNGRDQGRALLSARCLPGHEAGTEAFTMEGHRTLSLPDPFFIDALLQSAALLVPQDPCLPVAIDRVDFQAGAMEQAGQQRVVVELLACVDHTFHTRVTARDEQGRVVAHLEGYRLKIVRHVESYPTVDDLRSPSERDRRLVHEAMAVAAGTFGVDPPVLDVTHLPGIHSKTRSQRRASELPLLEHIAAQAADRHGLTSTGSVIWDDSGRPGLGGTARADLDISLSHDHRLCLTIAGPGPQGCDLAPITERRREQWEALLGTAGRDFLAPLMEAGDTLDQAGTRLWAAIEAGRKALSATAGVQLKALSRKECAQLLEIAAGDGRVLVLTDIVHLTWGPPRVLAVTVTRAAAQPAVDRTFPPTFSGLLQKPAYEVVPDGPQGELIFVQRFPVTFKPSAQLSRNVYFTHFFDWMGHAREASTWPIMRDLIDMLGTGKWGSVTNYSRLDVLGEARTGDLVELRMWTSDNGGPRNGTMTLQYDFTRIMPDGNRRRLAFSELQTTWVALVGPGLARPAPYPPVLAEFFKDMIPRGSAPTPDISLPSDLGQWQTSNGRVPIYQAAAGPVIHPQLDVHTFDTSLGQANAVGNIYYATYYQWQGILRDHYLQRLLPDHFGGIGERGEAVCLSCRVDHLREAMPFDRIMVRMALKTLYETRANLHFDYYRLEDGGAPVKLAWGDHQMVWVQRDALGQPRETPFPELLRQALEAAVAGDSQVRRPAPDRSYEIASSQRLSI